MKCVIHDFAGHPFQIQLSKELASRGHKIVHVYPEGLPGPKGNLDRSGLDLKTLEIRPVKLSNRFEKYSVYKRFISQRQYASALRKLIDDEKPDLVLSGNTPLDVQAELLWYCRQKKITFIHWVQDVYCRALDFFLRKKSRVLANALTLPFKALEKYVATRSDSVIVISPAFRSMFESWGVPSSKITVLENWAPLDEVTLHPRKNAWSEELGWDDKPVILYSGTLGLKHRPDLIYSLARSLGDQCWVVVLSEGIGRDYIERQAPLSNLRLLSFQPYSRLPEVLASADVLLATLEAEAGQFAVPSKILTYLCAGRPLLLAAPRSNLAAAVVERSGGGIVVDPDNMNAYVGAARKLISDPDLRTTMGQRARKYAEESFEIKRIAESFECVFLGALVTPTAAFSWADTLPAQNAEQQE